MQITKFSEIHKIIQDGKYKYIGLETKEGKTIIGYNGLAKDLDKRIKEIETRLKSPAFVDGEYIIVLKNTQFKNVKPDCVTITKGNANKSMSESVQTFHQSPEVLTWDEAKKMYQENAELKAQVNLLSKDLERAKETIIEQEEDIKALEADLDKYEAGGQEIEKTPSERPLLSEQPKPVWMQAISEFLPGIKSIVEVALQNKANQNTAITEQTKVMEGLAEELRALKNGGIQSDPGGNNLDEDQNMILDYFDSLREHNPEAYAAAIGEIKKAFGNG